MEETVHLDDTDYYNYDEKRDTKFYYKGQIISPEHNLDLNTRTFVYMKRSLSIKLLEINILNNKYKEENLFFVSGAEFISIQNIEMIKDNSGKQYVAIYLTSGDDNLKTGIYSYKLSDLVENNTRKSFTEIPHVYIETELHIPENFSLTQNNNVSTNIILTSINTDDSRTYIRNYSINFSDYTYTKNNVYTHDYVLSMPKIIQNDRHRVLMFKQRMDYNRATLVFAELDNNYDKITRVHKEGHYLYDIPNIPNKKFIEIDPGVQSTWIDENRIMFTVSVINDTGGELRPPGSCIYLGRINLMTGECNTKKLIDEIPDYLYYNFDLDYDSVSDSIKSIWVASADTNNNGYDDRDVFLTYGKWDQQRFNTINLSESPRSEWSPQLIKDNRGQEHYVWLTEHPKHGYQFYYRNTNDSVLANTCSKLNLPMYGDNFETIFTGVFYMLITIGLGVFEASVSNILLLGIIFIIALIVYKSVNKIEGYKHTLLLVLLATLVALLYGIKPVSFPINPDIDSYTFIGGVLVGLVVLLFIDLILYKTSKHTLANTFIKIWLFSAILSTYVNYDFVSTFIENNMIVNLG